VRFEWFVALRYLRQDRSQSALILAAVAVGVATIVFLSALIGGLQQSLLQKTLGSQPHVTLRIPDEVPRVLTPLEEGSARVFSVQKPSQRVRSIDQWPVRMAAIEAIEGVTAVAPIGTSRSSTSGRS
jgi:lipoprotein-releasing system permease protein